MFYNNGQLERAKTIKRLPQADKIISAIIIYSSKKIWSPKVFQKTAGEGVLIKLDDIYADVVVKVVDSSNTQDIDVELPEAIDGKTKLEDTLLKHIIKWRKCRLKNIQGKALREVHQ